MDWVEVDGGVLPRFTISFVTSLFVSCWNGLLFFFFFSTLRSIPSLSSKCFPVFQFFSVLSFSGFKNVKAF